MFHKTKSPRLLTAIALGVALLASAALVPAASPADAAPDPQKPLGFERWEDPGASCSGKSSGVDFNLTPASIVAEYAALMTIGLSVDKPAYKQKDRRLIDIEVHSDGSGLQNNVYDIVWVCNQGDFELTSWLVPGLTEQEVLQLDALEDVVIADLERYSHGTGFRFSAIVQRNSGKFATQVLLDTSDAVVQATQRRMGGRVLDIDYHSWACTDGGSDDFPQACPATRDAVIVENVGTNYVPTLDLVTGSQISNTFPPSGYQITDFEGNVDSPALSNWVSSGNPFVTEESTSTNVITHSHAHQGRIIDLEVDMVPDPNGLGSDPHYSAVNLTNQ